MKENKESGLIPGHAYSIIKVI